MKHTSRAALLLSVSLFLACSRSPEKGVAAPSPQSEPAAATSSDELAKEKKASADLADERDDSASGAAAPPEEAAPEQEPAPSASQATSQPATLLQQNLIQFDKFTAPEELSCSQAGPLKDAICGLAERICKDGADNALKAEKSCSQAKQTCKDVQERYRSKCQ